MNIAWNLWYIKKNDGTNFSEVAVSIDEGVISTQQEMLNDIVTGTLIATTVTRYRPQKALDPEALSYLSSGNTMSDGSGGIYLIYTSVHFGNIQHESDLYAFLNNEIAKDPIRIHIICN